MLKTQTIELPEGDNLSINLKATNFVQGSSKYAQRSYHVTIEALAWRGACRVGKVSSLQASTNSEHKQKQFAHIAYTTSTDATPRILNHNSIKKNTDRFLQGLLPELKLNMSSIPAPRMRRTAQNTQFT
jgi:hypothetical protein